MSYEGREDENPRGLRYFDIHPQVVLYGYPLPQSRGDAFMPKTVTGRVLAFGPVLLLIPLALGCALLLNSMRLVRADVGRLRDARLAAERVVSNVKDAETAQRSYVLTLDTAYLTPYAWAKTRLAQDSLTLKSLSSADQQARVAQLLALVAERMFVADTTIALQQAGQHEGAVALIASGRGLRLMNRIRDVTTVMDADVRAGLALRLADESRAIKFLIAFFIVGIIATAAVSHRIHGMLVRYAEAQEEAAAELGRRNSLLQEQAIELEVQQDELQQQATELEAQQVELEVQNEELQMANEESDVARSLAEQANAAKTGFLSSMSHELRTPLNAIAGYADLIEHGVYGPATDGQIEALRRIRLSGSHLLHIIDQILNYTGLSSQRMQVQLETVDIRKVFAEVEAMVRPQAEAKNLSLTFSCGDGPDPFADSNADRLRQILVNLTANAVKYTPAGGEIAVLCRSDSVATVIEVRDAGIGIPPESLESIFEPFVQLGRRRYDGAMSGVGLGLAICQELVGSLGGELLVHSEVGVGSTFSVILPAAVSAIASEGSIRPPELAKSQNPA